MSEFDLSDLEAKTKATVALPKDWYPRVVELTPEEAEELVAEIRRLRAVEVCHNMIVCEDATAEAACDKFGCGADE